MPRLLVSSRLQSVPYMLAARENKLSRSAFFFCTVQRHTYIRLPLWCAAGIDLEPTRIQKYYCTRRHLLDRPQTVILGDRPFKKGAKSACGGRVGRCSTPNGAHFSVGRRWTASPWESREGGSRPICANLSAGCDSFGLVFCASTIAPCTVIVLYVVWSVTLAKAHAETNLSKAE